MAFKVSHPHPTPFSATAKLLRSATVSSASAGSFQREATTSGASPTRSPWTLGTDEKLFAFVRSLARVPSHPGCGLWRCVQHKSFALGRTKRSLRRLSGGPGCRVSCSPANSSRPWPGWGWRFTKNQRLLSAANKIARSKVEPYPRRPRLAGHRSGTPRSAPRDRRAARSRACVNVLASRCKPTPGPRLRAPLRCRLCLGTRGSLLWSATRIFISGKWLRHAFAPSGASFWDDWRY